jgi:hypothetical protein
MLGRLGELWEMGDVRWNYGKWVMFGRLGETMGNG